VSADRKPQSRRPLVFPNELVKDLDVFGSLLESIILHQLDCAVVVAQD
jgi:hypothetical protein